MGYLTSSACFLPSYNTRSTLTFSRFPVSVLILPRALCRSARAPRDSTRAEGVGLAAVEKEEVRAGRARRQIERVSNTILTDENYLCEEVGGRAVLLLVEPEIQLAGRGAGVGICLQQGNVSPRELRRNDSAGQLRAMGRSTASVEARCHGRRRRRHN
jgi:hypothetical protein